MKLIKQFMAVFVFVFLASICKAEMTGSQWLDFKSSPEPIDGIQSTQVINSVPLKYCECLGYHINIPDGVTPGQLAKVVEKYLLDHPEMLHLEINYIICNAYDKSWGKKMKKAKAKTTKLHYNTNVTDQKK